MSKEEFLKKYNLEEITEEENFILDIKYATNNNFIGKILYDEPMCMLRKSTKEKLVNVNKELNDMGYKLKIWDAFRPLEYQKHMWELFPDERFVSNPDKGNSNHTKGSAVDVTICTLDGEEISMPTKFDHFGEESFRNNYDLCDKETKSNVLFLENIMSRYGFIPFETEWWHFNDCDDYDMIKELYEH